MSFWRSIAPWLVGGVAGGTTAAGTDAAANAVKPKTPAAPSYTPPPSADETARIADAEMQKRLAKQRGKASTILAGELGTLPLTAGRTLLGS